LVPEYGHKILILDEYGLCEFTAQKEFPGERLIACRNPLLQTKRSLTREALIKATADRLDKIIARAASGKLKTKENVALAVGRVIDKSKVKKHFILEFENETFSYSLNEKSISTEKALDGVYVIRTSLPVEAMSAEECVRQYKNLAQVERAFRTMKSVDLMVRPIYHHTDDRIRAHLFLTMLAYYVEWHVKEAWRELTFSDTELSESKKTRHPVAPAKRSDKASKKPPARCPTKNPASRP
jgi:transposase